MWLGLAGASSESSSSSEEEGRSPGFATFFALRAMAASFLALAAARRCSRVRVGEDTPAPSSAEDSSSSEDSSSEEDSTVFAASRGSCEESGFSDVVT